MKSEPMAEPRKAPQTLILVYNSGQDNSAFKPENYFVKLIIILKIVAKVWCSFCQILE